MDLLAGYASDSSDDGAVAVGIPIQDIAMAVDAGVAAGTEGKIGGVKRGPPPTTTAKEFVQQKKGKPTTMKQNTFVPPQVKSKKPNAITEDRGK